MKKFMLSAVTGLALSVSAMAEEIKTLDQKVSYGIGYNIGTQISQDDAVNVDLDLLFKGIQDAVEQKAAALTNQEISAAFQELQARMQAEQAEKAKAAVAEGQKFLDDNAKKDGVTVTESGLQYRVLTAGEGDNKPGLNDTVKTHYHGTLTDGTVFDSSVERGEPVEFPVSGVIKGWTEALQLMTVGDKWELTIPSELAYGANPPPSIPANAVLVFEVELLEVVKAATQN